MSEVMQEDRLAHQIYRLVREYVNRKAEAKSGKKFEDFKRDKDDEGNIRYPKEYLEAREKVCRDAFLAMRGRRDKYFIEYCTGTLCSVPQFLPEEDYVAVSHALVTDWETVKTLAMLALSAHSRIYAARK